MIKRTVEVSSRAKLNVRHCQLVLTGDDDRTVSLPMNEVGLLILDNPSLSYSHQVITSLMNEGAAIVFCDKNHMPVSFMVALEGNCVQTERLRWQVDMSVPMKKQLWKLIVKQKIKTQAQNLHFFSSQTEHLKKEMENTAFRLEEIARNVKSGDKENCEGQAARLYFQAMFGDTFHRDRDGEPPNNLLNYGYIVFRSTVARLLVGAGLHPSLGIFHRNRYNPFCLADDFLEIVRALVDREVKFLFDEGKNEINSQTKARLLSLLTKTTEFNGTKSPVSVALERMMSSVVKYTEGASKSVDFPELFWQ